MKMRTKPRAIWLYAVLLGTLLLRPVFTVGTLMALFLMSLLLYPRLGTSFFPRTDPAQFVMNIKAPLGTSLEGTERLIARVEELVRRVVPPEEYVRTAMNI